MDNIHTPQDNVEIPADDAVVVDTPALDENGLQVQEQAMTDSVPSSDFESLMREYHEGEEEDKEELMRVDAPQGQSEEEGRKQEDAEPRDDEDDDEEEEYSDDDDDDELQPPYGPVILPMPDLSGFTITLPGQDAPPPSPPPSPPPPPAPLAPLPDILHVPDLLKPHELDDPSPSLQGLQVCHLGRETNLAGEMQAMYLRLPPGTRMSRKSQLNLKKEVAMIVEIAHRPGCKSSRRRYSILHLRIRSSLAKRLDIPIRNYRHGRMESRDRHTTHNNKRLKCNRRRRCGTRSHSSHRIRRQTKRILLLPFPHRQRIRHCIWEINLV